MAGLALVLALTPALVPVPVEQTRAVAREVVLEASPLAVPALPVSVAQARERYGQVRKDLEATYREAGRYLAACTAERADLGAPRIVIPAEHAAEANVLMPFLLDQEFLALEGPVLERWNAWQSFLLQQGMAHPFESQRMAGHMLLLSSSKAEVATGTDAAPPGSLEIRTESGTSTTIPLPRRILLAEVLAIDRMEYAAYSDFAKQAKAFADQQAPALAEPWARLSGHLNRSASQLLDLDRSAPPTRDPGLRALRLQARINFMERFRSTLWLGQVVWAHLAGQRVLSIQQMGLR